MEVERAGSSTPSSRRKLHKKSNVHLSRCSLALKKSRAPASVETEAAEHRQPRPCVCAPANWDCLQVPQVWDELRANQQLCDGAIHCADGNSFKVHRAILSAVSPYFRALFTNSINGGHPETSEVRLEETSGSVLRHILDFAYTGRCAVSARNVEELLALADRLVVLGVVQQCCQFLVSHMRPDNCLGIFRLAQRYFCPGLEASCRRYILHHFQHVLPASTELGDLNAGELAALLRDDALNVRGEELVFEAVRRWVERDPPARHGLLPDLLACVRFGLAPRDFLASTVLTYEPIASDQELTRCLQPLAEYLATLPPWPQLEDAQLRQSLSRPRVPYEVLFAVGGWSSGSTTNFIETYDCRANRWCLSLHTDAQPRAYHGLVALDGLVYMIGGFDGDKRFNTVRCFDPVTHEWRECACMYQVRCYVSVCTLGGEIYAMGGCNGGGTRMSSAETYDPKKNQWKLIAPMNRARSDASAASLNGKVYIAGGFNGQEVLNSAEVFDPGTQQWSLIQFMNSARSGVSLIAHRGYLYALGGFSGYERLGSVERYDPAQAQWHYVQDMILSRSNFTTVVLDDLIYVIGGFNGTTTIANTECLDVDTNTWEEAKPMNLNRSGLAAVVLAGIPTAEEYSYLHVIKQEHVAEGQ